MNKGFHKIKLLMLLTLLKYLNIISVTLNDVAEPWQLTFQDGASPSQEGIFELHDTIMFYLIIILILVSWLFTSTIFNFNSSSNKIIYKYHNHGYIAFC